MSSKKGITFEVKIPKYNTKLKKEINFDLMRRKAGVHFKSYAQTRQKDNRSWVLDL